MAKILVVDDADLLEVMVTLLHSRNYEVKAIADGEDTYDAVDTFQPDLIILDIWLSGKDGREICMDLKSNQETSHIPILMFSAHPKAMSSIADIGADAFIGKPFEIENLLSKVEDLITGKK